jgi:hypothetical protein
MRKALFTTAVALGVAIASYAMMPPSARATTPNTCAILARSFTSNGPTQINAADQLHQMIQRKVYAACLQKRGKQGALRMTTPRAGTSTTNAGTFVTFDVPGAISTNPAAINNPGAITGSYTDAGGLTRSFLRTSDGTITPFDPPGAKCNPSIPPSICSLSYGINPAGTIAGIVITTPDTSTAHGFLRAPNGTITEFDVPFTVFTQALVINPDGVVAGKFFTTATSVVAHGFIRAPNGTITTFDPPGSTFTQPNAINPAGTVTGQFFDVTGVGHGFLRTSDGTITVFDPPGSFNTSSNAINPAGTTVGLFQTTPTFPVGVRGFLRAANGTITVFDAAPGSTYTNPQAISPGGTIVGFFTTTPDFSASDGFLRTPTGTISVFDPPGSLLTFVPGGGAMNPAGTVTGFFIPPDFSAQHGFVARLKNMQ